MIDNASGLGRPRRPLKSQPHEVEAFSLHATKPYGICEGGAIFAHVAWEARLRAALNFGVPQDTALPPWGLNGKMSELHAAVGLAVAADFDRRLALRQELVARYAALAKAKGFKAARVAARQIYVFSHAELSGWAGGRAAGDHVFEHFLRVFWQGPDKGWLRKVTTTGEPIDATPDLYDYAFALFALGWRYRAMTDPSALALAHQTLNLLDRQFRHPGGHGFHAALPPASPREQNPHMHLIEAALALAEISGEDRFLALAVEIRALFAAKLCRLPEGRLPEFFDDD